MLRPYIVAALHERAGGCSKQFDIIVWPDLHAPVRTGV